MLLRFSFLAAARWPCLFLWQAAHRVPQLQRAEAANVDNGPQGSLYKLQTTKEAASQSARQAGSQASQLSHPPCTHTQTHTHAVRRTSCTQKERRATKRRRRKLERQTKHGAVHKTLVPSTSAAAEPATPFPPSLSLSGFSFGYGFGIESGAGRLVLFLLVLVLDFFFCLLLLATSCWLLA